MDAELKKMSIVAGVMVTFAILCLVGISIVHGVGEVTRTVSTSTNESFVPINGSAVSLTYNEIYDYTFYNNSANTVVVSTSAYRLDTVAGTITQIDNSTYTSPTWYATYKFPVESETSTVANFFVTGLTVFATFSALISLVLVGKIIIKLIRPTEKND